MSTVVAQVLDSEQFGSTPLPAIWRRVAAEACAYWRGARSMRLVKCSARSTQQFRHRLTAPQAPQDRIRANADNRKASRPSPFECMCSQRQPTSTAHLFQAYFAAKILVS